MVNIQSFLKRDLKLNIYNKTGSKKNDWEFECDDILTLDIEVSSGWIDENGNLIGYKKGESEKYWNSLQPVSLCYIWQFSFNDRVYYGREFKDFIQVLKKLPSNVHFIIWVHNLAYEFQFLNNILKPWKSVFARNAHQPMKAVSELFPNIEFRCSYMLTRLSLDSWGKSLDFKKLHSLDYSIIRTPNTRLEKKEMHYCDRDCQVVYKGILKYLNKYKHIKDIPITQTGEIRRVIKKKVRDDKPTQRLMVKLIPKDAYMYSLMKELFQGGYTHANFTLSNIVHHDGYAFDFASSYPAVMCSDKFPTTAFVPEVFEPEKIEDFAYILKIKFTNLESKTLNHYISYAKSYDVVNARKDNGRIISADSLTIVITEMDWDIIMKTYNCDYEVLECYRSRKSYLPKCLIEYILELYGNKTTLKDVEGKEDLYSQSKQFINSLFGMSVTDLVQDEINFDGDTWLKEFKTIEDVEKYIKDLQDNNKGRTFIAYQFGGWTTSFARHNLWECIIPHDEDVIYCDTDSIKIREKVSFDWYNEKITKKLKDMCDFYDIDFELTRPKDKKGIEHPLGVFAEEDPWSEFKTLGAKRYCYRTKHDNKLHLTVSGVNKGAVDCLKDDINNFNEKTIFDKDEACVTKKYLCYCNNQPPVTWNKGKEDEYYSDYIYGINMRPTSYSMNISDEYITLLNSIVGINRLSCI